MNPSVGRFDDVMPALSVQPPPLTGMILAGGKARRMGGQDKGLIPYQGRPLIAHVLERLEPQVQAILINANRSHDQYAQFGHPVIADAEGGFLGPLAGILAGLRAAQTELLLCVPCDVGWNDVGSWDEVSAMSGESTGTHVFSENAHDNYVYPRESKVYGLAGVDDLVIVDTDDALLVARKGESQRVGEIVETMRRKGLPAATQHDHRFDTRPWGRYEVLVARDRFKAKLITVRPRARLSYQSHQHRDEHWIVVCGAGQVVLEGAAHDVRAGDYVFIAKGSRHRMTNPHDSDLQFVEVQLGNYFGEDDIARYEDDYQRCTLPPGPDTGPS